MADTPAQEPTPAEQRINALVAKTSVAEAGAAAAAETNKALTARLTLMENHLLTQAKPAAPSAPADAAPAVEPAALSAQDIQKTIVDAVQAAVKPINDRFAQDDVATEIANAQGVSYQQAVAQFPELAKPDSTLRQTAQRLWDGRPDLAGLKDAPLVITNIAAGILGEQRKAQRVVDASKVQANVNTPTPPSNRERALPDADDRTKLAEAILSESSNVGVVGAQGNEAISDIFRANLQKQIKQE